jgi:hypothetical protein
VLIQCQNRCGSVLRRDTDGQSNTFQSKGVVRKRQVKGDHLTRGRGLVTGKSKGSVPSCTLSVARIEPKSQCKT